MIEVTVENTDGIEIEVLQQDEIEVAIENIIEVEVQAFDYPPEIESLTRRVAAIEEASNGVIWEYTTTPQDGALSQIDTPALSIPSGRDITIFMFVPAGWSTGAVNGGIRVNDINSANYAFSTSGNMPYLQIYGANGYAMLRVDMILINGNLHFISSSSRKTAAGAWTASNAQNGSTYGLSMQSINKLSLLSIIGAFPAGTHILIKYK